MFRSSTTAKNFGSYKIAGATKGGSPNYTATISPSSISGLAMWYKADALSLNNGDNINSWTDSGPNLRHMPKHTVAPTYTSSFLNGKPGVKFPGASTTCFYTASIGQTWTSGITAFWVGNASGSLGNFGILCMNAGGLDYQTGETYMWHGGWAGGPPAGTNLAWRGAGGTEITTDWYSNAIWKSSIQQTGSNVIKKIFRNGVNLETNTFAAAGGISPTNCVIGARAVAGPGDNPFKGVMAEMIVYNTKISDADEDAVTSYLNTKYSVY